MASERETVGRDNLVELSLLLELIPNTGTKDVLLKRSIGQIKRALESKNEKFIGILPETAQRSALEMDKRGAQTKKINELAIEYQQLIGKRRTVKFERKLGSNAGAYIDARLDEMMVCSMHDLLSRSNINKTFKQEMIKALTANRRKTMRAVPKGDRAKKSRYNQIVQQYYTQWGRDYPLRLLEAFNSSRLAPCWEALTSQLYDCQSDLQAGDSLSLRHKLRRNTLRLLEQRFSETMPTNQHSFEQAVRFKLGQLELNDQVYFDNSNRPIWALAYYLKRAGRTEQMWAMLHNHPEARVAEVVDSLEHTAFRKAQHLPQTSYRDVEDLFLKQLQHIANHEAVSSPQLISEILDFIWLGLQTCSLESAGTNEFSLEELQSYVAEKVRQDPLNPMNTHALFYSTNYQQLLEVNNSICDYEDSVHLALFFSQAKFEDLGLLDMGERNLNNIIIDYAKDLSQTSLPAAVCYINLIDTPSNHKLINFLVENDLPEDFFGLSAQKPIIRTENAPQFQTAEEERRFTKQLLEQYSSRKKKHMACYRIAKQFLRDNEECLSHMLNFQLEGLMGNWADSTESVEFTKVLEAFKLSSEFTYMPQSYKTLLLFIEEVKFLERACVGKNIGEIKRIRSNSLFFPVQKAVVLPQPTLTVLEVLEERGCLLAFMNYVMLIIQTTDVCFSFLNESKMQYEASLQAILLNFAKVISRLKAPDREVQKAIDSIQAALKLRLES